jgi:hypothetical protein
VTGVGASTSNPSSFTGGLTASTLNVTGVSTLAGGTITGTFLPITDINYDLGSSAKRFNNIYAESVHIGPSSLYMDGVKVLSSTEATMTFTADTDQNLQIKTLGGGNLQFIGQNSGNLQLSTSGVGSVQLSTIGTNTNISLNAAGSGSQTQLAATSAITLTAPTMTFAGTLNAASLASSQILVTDSSKNLVSMSSLPIAYGGTGAATFTTNGIMFGNGTSAVGVTAAGTSGQLLVAGSGGIPAFVTMSGDATIAYGGGIALKSVGTASTYGSATQVPVFTTDAQGRVTGVTSTSIAIEASAITSGTLPATLGGTGLSSYTAGDLIYASATNTLARRAATTDGYVLTLASGLPTWAAAGAGSTPALQAVTDVGAVTTTAVSLNGGVTLGDTSGDALTVTSSAAAVPNGLNFDSNTLAIDAANNRVGIGAAAPITQLHVPGSLPTSAAGSVALGGGGVEGMTVSGDYAYVTIYGSDKFEIVDISNPASPALLSSSATDDEVNYVSVQGKYAYVTSYGGQTLRVWDISNPTAPTSVGSVAIGSKSYSNYVQGRYVYVAGAESNFLRIFDVANPAAPAFVGSVSTTGNALGVYVKGKYAYVTDYSGAYLRIFDVSNPASPSAAGFVATGAGPSYLYVQGKYAYVPNSVGNTLKIFDVSDPATPALEGSVATGTAPAQAYVQGRYAYVSIYNGTAVQVIDVSNPASPSSVGNMTTGSSPYGLAVKGRYAYVVDSSPALKSFDLGGAYIQQLEAGGIEAGTLSLRNSLKASEGSFAGGLGVGTHLQANGTLAVGGASYFGGNVTMGGATSGAVTLATAAAAGTWTLTLPTSGGTSGYVLQTNGSGTTTWAAAGSASQTPWTSAINAAGYTLYGNNTTGGTLTLESTSHGTKGNVLINPNGGNVGIGKTPGATLDVNGQILMANDSLTTPGIAFSNATDFGVGYSSGTPGNLLFYAGGILAAVITPGSIKNYRIPSDWGYSWGSCTSNSCGPDTGLSRGAANKIYVGNGTVGDYSGTLIAGNVGIGTTSPGSTLSVGSGTTTRFAVAGATGNVTTSGTIAMNGSSSGAVTLTPAAAAGTWTLTLPTSGGTNGYVLQTDGSGTTTWAAAGGSGANTALSNLASVAINTALLPGTNDSIDLGDTSHRWANTWLGGETLHIGASATDEALISYSASGDVLNIGTDSTTNGDIAFNTDDLYIDKSTSHVGIGTASPTGLFQVYRQGSSINLIPAMTSNTEPSGTASCSSYYTGDPRTNCYAAFNGMGGTGWLTNFTSTGWLKYEFPSAQIVKSYSIVPWSYSSLIQVSPKTWTFEGSNNDSDWTVLDTQTNYTNWTAYVAVNFSISNSTAYKYYRLNVTANGGESMLGLQNLAMYGDIAPGTALFVDSTTGQVGFNTTTTSLGQVTIVPNTSATAGLVIKGQTSQSANLQSWLNSSGTVLSAVTASGYLGVGTGSPTSLFSVGSSSQFQVTNDGNVTSSGTSSFTTVTPSTTAVTGNATSGSGVIGTASTGHGVGGTSSGAGGIGVFAYSSGSGSAGVNAQGTQYGVVADASDTSGATFGLKATAASPAGSAVYAYNSNASGYGVYSAGGLNHFNGNVSAGGTLGVTSLTTLTGGLNVGSAAQFQIDGSGNVTSSGTVIVTGTSGTMITGTSTSGWGVGGSTSTGVGVNGAASGTSGTAISGTATGTGGVGVNAQGPIGVYAVGSGTTGVTYGVEALDSSPDGYAVYAHNTNASGYAFFANGGLNYFNGNTGIGRTPATYALEVNGDASKSVAGAWQVNSDRRIKTDVAPLGSALDVIDRLNPVQYRYTDAYLAAHPEITDTTYYNFVAQEFQQVFPDSVRATNDSIPGVDHILSVDNQPSFVYSVAAIKELSGLALKLDRQSGEFEVKPAAAATALVPAVGSKALALQASVWNAAAGAAGTREFTLTHAVGADGASRLAVGDGLGGELAYFGSNGDAAVKGRLRFGTDGSAGNRYLYNDSSETYAGDRLVTSAMGFGARGAGFAELMPSNDALAEGELVMVDTANAGNVIRSVNDDSHPNFLLAGVVAKQPAYLAGVEDVGKFPITVSGRAKVKVSTENGPIVIGDPITVAALAGAGRRTDDPAYIIGVALEAYSGSEPGLVTVFVRPGWFNGTTIAAASDAASGTPLTANITAPVDFKAQPLIGIGAMEGIDGLWSIDGNGRLTAKEVVADKVVTKQVAVEVDDQSQAVGEGVILLGNSEVTIDNALIQPNSNVFITFYGNTEGSWWIDSQIDGHLTIKMSKLASTELKFKYLVMAVVDNRTPTDISAPPATVPDTTDVFTLSDQPLNTSSDDSTSVPLGQQQPSLPEGVAHVHAEVLGLP